MIQTSQTTETLPRTLEEFIAWEPTDGFKYEWNDGEIIQFTGMQKEQMYIYDRLIELFFELGYNKTGTLIAEQNVHLSGIQLHRPDICYLTRAQVNQSARGADTTPAFAIEVISKHDKMDQLEQKLTEYFQAGVQVVWLIVPKRQVVHVYTSRRKVTICLGSDICSAAPVLPDFEIQVDALLALPEE